MRSLIFLLFVSMLSCDRSLADEVQVEIDGTNMYSYYQQQPLIIPETTMSAGGNNYFSSMSADPHHDDEKLSWDLGEDMGVEQEYDEDLVPQIQGKLQEARRYMESSIHSKYSKVLREKCRNKNESCAFWAASGECEQNPAFMNETCAPVCLACEGLILELRCPLDPNAVDAWRSGDLNRMFERITTHPDFVPYEPHIVSRPSWMLQDSSDDIMATAVDSAPYQLGPWIITLDKFLSSEEADRFMELGKEEGYERSFRVGGLQWDGTSEIYYDDTRTSTSVYCQTVCYNDTTTRTVMRRMEQVTGIPESHYQHLQFIRYETGQHFTVHHDYIPYQRHRQQGVRLFTLFFYFNDVEEGGGTNFPLLNVTIMPKKGRAVIWPLVLDDDPNSRDDRMDHQALPVLKGIKYAANNHVHQNDFKKAHSNRCS